MVSEFYFRNELEILFLSVENSKYFSAMQILREIYLDEKIRPKKVVVLKNLETLLFNPLCT